MSSEPSLISVVRLIRSRYESVAASYRNTPRAAELTQSIHSLRLTEAFLEKGSLCQSLPQHPLQIAVIGPTQAGKSSLVNRLLGEERAHVSPLAGHTVHAQGFRVNVGDDELTWMDTFFDGFKRRHLNELVPGEYDQYVLDPGSNRSVHPLPPCVVWDTPDFDSINADEYRNSVLKTVALADVVLLVVSQDKYSDQSVWQTMGLIEPLEQPTLVCLNKLNEEARATLVHSLREKWRGARGDQPVDVCTLLYRDDWENVSESAYQSESTLLYAHLNDAIARVDRRQHQARCKRLLAKHWNSWLKPIRAEQSAGFEWNQAVENAVADALSGYERNFLDHPQHYETFQLALAELLTLLEIPGIAKALIAARQIVTWPIRQLGRFGKRITNQKPTAEHETAVLQQVGEHVFVRLRESALEHSEAAPEQREWWRELSRVLQKEHGIERVHYFAAIENYNASFRPEIERVARQLYEKLQENPTLLNSLRATRLTTDAAALALALHTGGIGVHDFIIAPAILSLTSLLTEGALGQFLKKSERELKQRQLKAVELMLDQQLRMMLLRLPEKLTSADKFNIPADYLQTSESLVQ